jgi:hypothetical protein
LKISESKRFLNLKKEKKKSGFHDRSGGVGQVPLPEYLIF